MVFSYSEYLQLMGLYFYPFVRIGGMLLIIPLFGGRGVPARARLILAVVITIAVAPMLELPPPVSPFTWHGVLLIAQQFGIGLATGLIFLMVFQAFVIAGYLAAMAMGLAFAQMVDPITGANSPVIGRYYTITATLLFLLFGGHILVIHAIVQSFDTMPIGLHFLDKQSLKAIVNYGSTMFAVGVLIALPIVTALLLVNISLGVIARAVPAMNIFAIGFSITLLVGLVMLMLTTPLLVNHIQSLMHSSVELISSLRLNN